MSWTARIGYAALLGIATGIVGVLLGAKDIPWWFCLPVGVAWTLGEFVCFKRWRR